MRRIPGSSARVVCELLEQRLMLSVTPAQTFEVREFTGESQYSAGVEIYHGITPSPENNHINSMSNADAGDTINVDQLWSGGGLGLALDGDGYTVGVWDGDHVRATHQEFGYRVTYGDTVQYWGHHATHVAGTIGASGVYSGAQGMAEGADILSYEWGNDVAELRTAASSIVVSNHSYARTGGWTTGYSDVVDGTTDIWHADRYSYTEDPLFGKYDSETSSLDDVLYDNPGLLSVWSAGNDRDDQFTDFNSDNSYVTYLSGNPGVTTYPTYDGPDWYQVWNSGATSAPGADGNNGTGYDSLPQKQTAKNTLVVGAIGDITDDPYDSGDVTMTSFSSWGCTDDGRIGVDVVANGVSVCSPVATSNNAYNTYTGTSMAAPSVTGAATLLIEHYNNLFGDMPTSATTKGTIIHTAFDAGNTGPDYCYGWGVVDAAAAANFLTDTDDSDPSNWVAENSYSGHEWTGEVYSDGTTPLKATICWTDPAGTAQAAGLDVSTSVLVNDLDIWVTGPGGTYYPWTLDPSDPDDPAVRTAANHLDNVEQVLIDSPTAGTYTVHVGHTGTSSIQNYSLILSGASDLEQTAAPIGLELNSWTDTGKQDGIDNDDDITSRNNADASSKLSFAVYQVPAYAIVRIYAGDTEIAWAQNGAGQGTLNPNTNGTVELIDGDYDITATFTLAGKLESARCTAETITIDTEAPEAPSAPDLQAGSDLGKYDNDEITKDDTPIFDLTGGDTYFRFYRDTTQISGDYASGSSYTAGAQSDGTYDYQVTAVDVAGNESALSTALEVTVDTAAPTVSSVTVNDGADQRNSIDKLAYQFSENIDVSSESALLVYYYDGQWLAETSSDPTLSVTTNTATWTWPEWTWTNQDPDLLMPDYNGYLVAKLQATQVADIAGNALAADYLLGDDEDFHRLDGDIDGSKSQSAADYDHLVTMLGTDSYDIDGDGDADVVDAFVLAAYIFDALEGDTNLDGEVNLVDFNILKLNFESGTGNLWSEGDFTGDGEVKLADFNLLKANFESSDAEINWITGLGTRPVW